MESKNVDPVTNTPVIAKKGAFPATVAKVIDEYKIVINRGSEHGIREGQRMLVYHISGEDIKDPDTGESLGFLELVRGTGKIIFIQDKLSILESDKQKIVPISYNYPSSSSNTFTEKTIHEKHTIPFENPKVGDQVKPI
ncbi:hypothetical protein [Crocosphaera sp.]|uniref:hypothetical protein n=1 Tax=Crocosphaera sp. TaxID=2729996 RepID=UPI003F1E6752